MRPVHAVPLEWDRADPRNAGVLADERVGFHNAGELRRVAYRDPAGGAELVFLTSDMELPPGLVAELYRRRWDIEKAFDEFENKQGQGKAWATSGRAKRMQSHFVALARNLLLLLEAVIEEGAGIRDQKCADKRLQAAERELRRAEAAGAGGDPALLRRTLLCEGAPQGHRVQPAVPAVSAPPPAVPILLRGKPARSRAIPARLHLIMVGHR